jgi:hypothetical protein
MGTRGCVAVRQPGGGWRGVYNQFDSYPTGLGSKVYAEAKKKGLKKLAEEVLSFGDWREYESGGICEFCGKKAGQPHTIEGTISGYTGVDYAGDRKAKLKAKNVEELTEAIRTSPIGGAFPEMAPFNAQRQWPIVQNMKRTGYPDPEVKHHKHGDGPEDQITDKDADALYIEWVYVLDPVENTIDVLKSRAVKGKVRKSGVSEYEHIKVTSIPMKGKAPDWKHVQKLGQKAAGYDEDE